MIAGAAFKTVIPTCTAPEIQLFKRFRDFCEYIDLQKFEDAFTDEIAAQWIADIKEDMINLISSMLLTTENQPRNDSRKLLELALLFFGGASSQKIQFKALGANNHARWMAKIISFFKIWMFPKQFTLTARELKGLRDLCVFLTRIFIKV